MITIWKLLTLLPEIIQLLRAIEKANQEAQTERKVKDDLKSIHEAFSANDSSKLDHIFNPPK